MNRVSLIKISCFIRFLNGPRSCLKMATNKIIAHPSGNANKHPNTHHHHHLLHQGVHHHHSHHRHKLNPEGVILETQVQVVKELIKLHPQKQSIVKKPIGCPVGLERLTSDYQPIIICRRLQNSKHFLGKNAKLMAYSQYDIVVPAGRRIFLGVESTTLRTVRCIRDARHFEITMYDYDARKIWTIKRPGGFYFWFAQYVCCFFTFGFKGCGNIAEVTHFSGISLGTIKQFFSLKEYIFGVYNSKGKQLFTISGSINNGFLEVFRPSDEEAPIAIIDIMLTAAEAWSFYRIQVAEILEPYGLKFLNSKVTPKEKSLLISAVILLDFILCKANSDYPHWLEFLPPDYRKEVRDKRKIYRDGLKEIVVVKMKDNAHKRIYQKKQHKMPCSENYRCLVWFFSLICMCFPMAVARNAFRCSLLSLVVLIVFIVVLLYLF